MTSQLPQYVIDANIFIQAARSYYSFEFAQPFWNKLRDFGKEGRIVSVDKVLDEIMEGNDQLKNWANSDFKEYFKKAETREITEHYREIVLWAEADLRYDDSAKRTFMERTEADAWVVAYAKTYNCTVVTSEVNNLFAKITVPIPNVCAAFNIPYCDTFGMLKALNFKF